MRKKIKSLSAEETAELLEGLYRSCPEAADYMNITLAGDDFKKAYLGEMKEKLRGCFYNRKGKASLDMNKARDLIGRFEHVCPDRKMTADLKVSYIELGMDIIRHYRRIPDSLYIGLENTAESLAEMLNAAAVGDGSGKVESKYRDQLELLATDFMQTGDYIYGYLSRVFGTISWGKEEEAVREKSLSGSGDASGEETFPPAPLLILDSSNVLSSDDVKLFYRIFFGLLDYVNGKKKVNDLKDLAAQESLDPQAVKEIARVVWQDISLIDDYLSERGSSLPAEEEEILRSWKRVVSGRFVIERNLKNGSIVIGEDNRVYLVRGIATSLEEMFFYRPLPVMINADLLPFKGVIITDGLVSSMNIFMGGGIKKQLKDEYNSAKRRGMIHTSL